MALVVWLAFVTPALYQHVTAHWLATAPQESPTATGIHVYFVDTRPVVAGQLLLGAIWLGAMTGTLWLGSGSAHVAELRTPAHSRIGRLTRVTIAAGTVLIAGVGLLVGLLWLIQRASLAHGPFTSSLIELVALMSVTVLLGVFFKVWFQITWDTAEHPMRMRFTALWLGAVLLSATTGIWFGVVQAL